LWKCICKLALSAGKGQIDANSFGSGTSRRGEDARETPGDNAAQEGTAAVADTWGIHFHFLLLRTVPLDRG
jgi:hypothetical protein